MRTLKNLDELKLPYTHKKFIECYLDNIKDYECIDRIILFGSCARGTMTAKSDVDLFVITSYEIPEELEFDIIFDKVPELQEGYVKNDILLKSKQLYEKYINVTGMVQKAVELEGVDLSGLLPVGNR